MNWQSKNQKAFSPNSNVLNSMSLETTMKCNQIRPAPLFLLVSNSPKDIENQLFKVRSAQSIKSTDSLPKSAKLPLKSTGLTEAVNSRKKMQLCRQAQRTKKKVQLFATHLTFRTFVKQLAWCKGTNKDVKRPSILNCWLCLT